MRRALFSLMSAVVLLNASRGVWAGPPVAPTEALTPAEQQKKFKLPAGFEIQLVAAEPEIQKPMNLAFDARGRLWVTHSIEYPFAVPEGQTPRDGLTVLSGLGPDGRARQATKFAEQLHIPIGVVPLGTGSQAIVWSIPNLWKLTDDDGDGRADRREILYGPFDFVDTHGNQNAFRLGHDGWIYACHGFRNDSKIKLRGEGDVVLHLNSGNTYRFRPDGSAIEQLTWGQVNPFGMCFDRWGNRFTADCHSKAITMLLRGGHYESFGKPHDGLGFAPPMTAHGHDSTGIAGVAYYDATQFPNQYRDCFYIGNVVTNVIHRDVAQWRGSSPWVEQPHDFVVCDDPWFHPVDLQVGPDGALYIADFYNSIIGHYEVDLKHPRRDRTRGRIWRVVWKGTDDEPASPPPPLPDLTRLKPEALVERMGDENLALRTLATQQLLERGQAEAIAAVESHASDSTELERAQAIGIHARHGDLDALARKQRSSPDQPLVRVRLLQAIAEQPAPDADTLAWAASQLADANPFVRRAAADTLGQHPRCEHVERLLAAWKSAESEDTQFVQTIRLALRKQLRVDGGIGALAARRSQLTPEQARPLLDIALAVPSAEAADFVFAYLSEREPDSDLLDRSVAHVARWSSPAQLDAVAALAQKQFAGDLRRQAALLRAVLDGKRQRGAQPPAAESPARRWAVDVASRLLNPQTEVAPPWANFPLDAVSNVKPSASPWGIRPRRCADGQEAAVFDSIVNGEQLTGVLRSAPFTIPAKLSFWMCGHNGLPGTSPPAVNHIRLRLTDGDEIVARQTPPRNDVAQHYEWDLTQWEGKKGVVEIVDADAGTAYAWIGVGRFEPAVVAQPSADVLAGSGSHELALQVVEALRIATLLPEVLRLLDDRQLPGGVRSLAMQTGFTLDRAAVMPRLTAALADAGEPLVVRAKAAELLGAVHSDESRAALASSLATVAGPLQQQIAVVLVSTKEGAEAFLAAVAAGKASPRLLQDKAVMDRLNTVNVSDQERRIAELTKGLPAADERIRQLVSQRLASFQAATPSAEKGAAVFKKNCATCHRVAGEGPMIGPQLDGIGVRGPERLLEDILDPNRNVDAAFRVMIVTTTGGQVLTGLKLREEGQTLVLADNQGKEVRVAMDDIDESRLSALSLMPTNVTETIPDEEMMNLLAYLVQLRLKPVTSPDK